ncbi:hypothetical protein N7454_001658 [Penicillium verhagenii]|nr:hypothetical protein N7454_001658 [Penicillium verhagenii]
MRVLNALLPLAGLLAFSNNVLAKDIDKCTQVTRNFVTNGDFTTDSDWTTSVIDATIVTPEESGGSGYLEIPFTAGETFTIQTPVSGIQSGPIYQLNVDWNLIADTEAQARCDMEIFAITDTSSHYITYAIDYTDETSGFQTVLGQWFSDSSDIQLEFSVTCYDGSGTLQLAAVSFMGPEMVCTSQCAVSTTTLSGNLIQDGDFTDYDEDDDVWTAEYVASTSDDDAPGGGQCFVISQDNSGFYELNQTISDAQVGQRYHASLSWRLKSSVANADIEPSCSIWYSIYNDTARVLLNIAYGSYTLSSSDSGWMSLNGTWNATVSSGEIIIHVECSASDYEYYPEVEIANVEFALQTVNCIAPSSSAVVASSTPLVKSSTASSSPVSTPVIRSTPVPSSTTAIRSAPVTRSSSIIRSTSASHLSSPYISSTPVSKHSTSTAVIPESTPLSSSVSSVSLIRSTSSGSSSPSVKVSTPLSVTRSRVTGSSSISIPTTLSPSNPTSTPTADSFSSSSTSLEPSGKASQTSTSVSETGHASSITSSATSNSQIVSSSSPVETATPLSAASLPNKQTSTLSQTTHTTQTQPQLTTSTVFTTSTRTVTACPSTITNCPVTAKTTYVTTETIVVSTTVCPVTETKEPHQTTTPQAGNGDYTSTILTTREVTITSCAATVTDCPARSQTTLISTQTLVAGTTIIPAGSSETASQIEKGGATGSPNSVPVQIGTTASAASGESSTATLPTLPSADKTGTLASSGSLADISGVQSSTSSAELVNATSLPEEEPYSTSVTTTITAGASALTLNGANPTVALSGADSSSETLASSAAMTAGGNGGFPVESKTTPGPVITSTYSKPSASSSASLISTGWYLILHW